MAVNIIFLVLLMFELVLAPSFHYARLNVSLLPQCCVPWAQHVLRGVVTILRQRK